MRNTEAIRKWLVNSPSKTESKTFLKIESMKTLDLRQTDKQPIAQRCHVKRDPCQAAYRLKATKVLAAVLAGSLWIPALAFSEDDQTGKKQTPAPMQSPQAGQMNTDVIAGKLAELQNQLQRIETMLRQQSQNPGKPGPAMSGNMKPTDGNMEKKEMPSNGPQMESGKMMGKMDTDKGKNMGSGMTQPPATNMQSMPMEKEMEMMGMAPAVVMKESALPGFPGASHLYHIGSTGFFLDHSEHITLTIEQQKSLNQMKEDSELAKNTAKRKIDQAEQELWQLTSADQPDEGKIEAKIGEIEKFRGDERLAFIRSVGEAAKVLTDEQQKSLTGVAPPAPAPMPTPAPAAATPASSPMPADGMKEM
jgi:Spy/CpxP family protein refolding chaperone